MFIRSILLSCSALLLIGCGGGDNSGDLIEADSVAPEITLNGESDIEVLLHAEYIEEGATAVDNVDGSVNVEISGEVDTDKLGKYFISYKAHDSSDNYAEKKRLVSVVDNLSPEKTKISVLAIYNPEANNLYNGNISTRLNHIIAYSNEINDNSGIRVSFNLVHSEEIYLNQDETSMKILEDVQNDENIEKLRNKFSADEVFIYRPYANDNVCGIAYINKGLYREFAFAHITVDCPSDTTSHEMGHNFGLAHSHKQSGDGIFPYSFGHGIDGEFATVMAYASSFNVNENEPVYSSPLLDCKGQPCGIEEGYSGEADAARTIIEVKEEISKFN